MKHQFFKILDMAEKNQKKGATWGMSALGADNSLHKQQFFQSLPIAHPFVFDKSVSFEKIMSGRSLDGMENLVEEFSMPFKNSVYLLTSPASIDTPLQGDTQRVLITTHGYLITEHTPEKFLITQVSWIEVGNHPKLPHLEIVQLDLKTLRTGEWKSTEDQTVKMHFLKECGIIMNLTKSISVKRIGIERSKNFSIKSKGVSRNGYTTVKADNIVHIADKINYEYTESLGDGEINWEWVGYWRGHWRAFYVKDSGGKNVKDFRGWNIVDYSRTGKNREGLYSVEGYTWVKEHTKGDPALAEIKTRTVKKG